MTMTTKTMTSERVVALMQTRIDEVRRGNATQGGSYDGDLSAADCNYVVEGVEERAGRKPTRAEWTAAYGQVGYIGGAHYEG